jgi:hypothetical protein
MVDLILLAWSVTDPLAFHVVPSGLPVPQYRSYWAKREKMIVR